MLKKTGLKVRIKRALSVLLTAAMMLSGMNVYAYDTAAPEETQEQASVEETQAIIEEDGEPEASEEASEEEAEEAEAPMQNETASEEDVSASEEDVSASEEDVSASEESETDTEQSAEALTEALTTEEEADESSYLEEELEEAASDLSSEEDENGNIASGSYGNVTWEIDSDGKLTVSGTGDFKDGSGSSSVPWYSYRTNITSAVVNLTGATDLSYMFWYCEELRSVDLSGLDTSEVTNMSEMFETCWNLDSLDLSNFDTSSVTSMSCMFSGCDNLTSLDLSSFDTSNVTSMSYMFNGCCGLTSLDLSGFDTAKVTNMSDMFAYCTELTSLDISSFDTGKVTKMNYMFAECYKLESLDLSSFDTSNVTDMSQMFMNCYKLDSLDISSFDTGKVKSIWAMFGSCTALTSLDLSNFDLGSVTSGSSIISGTGRLTEIDTPVNLAISIPIMETFQDDEGNFYSELPMNSSESIHLFRTNGVGGTDGEVEWSVDASGKLAIEGTGDWDEREWLDYSDYIISAEVTLTGATSMSEMFSECYYLESVVFTAECDTSDVADMSRMFYHCYALKYADLSALDTSGVTDMSGMFSDCEVLADLNISGFDTSEVTDMNYMFYDCMRLNSLDVSEFDTGNVTDMSGMFTFVGTYSNLQKLDVSSFDTGNVTNMSDMFAYCYNISELDVSGFDTSNVTDMSYMFDSCTHLTSLDLSSFDMENVETVTGMLSETSQLVKINAPLNLSMSVSLPAYGYNGAWYRGDNGSEITELPQGLTESVCLYTKSSGLGNEDSTEEESSMEEESSSTEEESSSTEEESSSTEEESSGTEEESSTPTESSSTEESSTPTESSSTEESSTPTESSTVEESSTPTESSSTEESSTPTESSSTEESSTPTESSTVEESSTPDNADPDRPATEVALSDKSQISIYVPNVISNGKNTEQHSTPVVTYTYTENGKSVSRKLVDGWQYTVETKAGCDYMTTGVLQTYVIEAVTGSGFTGSVERSYTIYDKKSEDVKAVSKLSIKLAQKSYDFTGYAIEPEVSVMDGQTELEQGTDYDIVYKNNYNAGKASVIVIGEGSYTGTKELSFTIKKVKFAYKNPILSYTKDGYKYAGSAVTLSDLSVKLESGYELVEGTDYTVSYKSNIGKGTAWFTVKAAGNNFSGSRTGLFEIEGMELSDIPDSALSEIEVGYSSKGAKLSEIRWGGYVLKEGTDYRVNYHYASAEGKGKKVGDVVPVEIIGKSYYLKGQRREASIKVVAADFETLSVKSESDFTIETGKWSKRNSQVVVKDYTGVKLKLDKDYELTWDESDNGQPAAGLTLTISPINEDTYTGTKTVTYRVASKLSAKNYTISDKYFNGKTAVTITPADIIPKGGEPELSAEDYEVTGYKNNAKAGKASVTLKGKGKYYGTITLKFTVKD